MTWLVPRAQLTSAQLRAVEMDPREHRVVLGSPGSGKTLVALHRARHLADEFSTPPERFRIFVFTNALKAYIQSALADLRLPGECVLTFDQWCREYYRAHIGRHLPWSGNTPDFQAIRSAIRSRVRAGISATLDFAMVDEGQDLDLAAYEILARVAHHLTVFMDSKQRLYETDASERGVLRALGLRHGSALLDAYRCTPYIARVAASCIRDEAERERFLEQNQRPGAGERQKPLVHIASGAGDAREHLIEVLRTCVDRRDRVGMLLPSRSHLHGCARALAEAGLEVELPPQRWRTAGGDWLAHDFASPRPKLMAYPSAKGLTFDSVLLPLFNRRHFRRKLRPELLERWLFVAFSRAIRWLYISGEEEILHAERWRALERQGQLEILRGGHGPGPEAHAARRGSPEREDLSDLF